MTKHVAPPKRAGQETAPQDGGRTYILLLFADDSHGALDRIIGLLRRRRVWQVRRVWFCNLLKHGDGADSSPIRPSHRK